MSKEREWSEEDEKGCMIASILHADRRGIKLRLQDSDHQIHEIELKAAELVKIKLLSNEIGKLVASRFKECGNVKQ